MIWAKVTDALPPDLSALTKSVLDAHRVGKAGCGYCRDGVCVYDGGMWAELPFGCSFNTGNRCWAMPAPAEDEEDL